MKLPAPIHALLILLAGIVYGPSASATLLVEETFSYTDGNLVSTKNGGIGFSNTWSRGSSGSNWTVSGETAMVAGQGSGWALRSINGVTTDSFYFSLNVSVNTLDRQANTNFVDVAILNIGGTTLQAGIHYWSYGYHVVLSSSKLGESGKVEKNLTSSAQTETNTTFTIVGYYTFDTDNNLASLSMWLNPPAAPTDAAYSVSWSATDADLSRFTLQRYDDNTTPKSGNTVTTFDNFRVGTEWSDVVPSTIPEASAYAPLAGISALGAALLRRRR